MERKVEKKMGENKMKISGERLLWKAAALIIGAAILAGWIMTGRAGISKKDQEIYASAQKLQPEVDRLGFQNFKLADYPVAMYDGKQDYVFYQGEIKERAPVLETFAGTAYPVEDHFEVIVPTLDKLDSLMSLTGGVEDMISGSGYGEKEQIATIWHETFHAWQMSHYAILGEKMEPSELTAALESDNTGESEDEILVKAVDQKDDVKKAVEQEMKTLKVLTAEVSIDEVKKGVLEYRKSVGERRKQMPKEAVEAEERCELTEGTAYYVEANVLKMQSKSGQKYQERYLDSMGQFEGGRGKYYRTGMAKCMILDKIDPGWEDRIDFSKSLDTLLDEAVR